VLVERSKPWYIGPGPPADDHLAPRPLPTTHYAQTVRLAAGTTLKHR